MHVKKPFIPETRLPTGKGFQFLEDLATAYWYAEVLFAAIELSLFDLIRQGKQDLDALAAASGCEPDRLLRLLKTLQSMELILCKKNSWHNSPEANRFLVSESRDYMGNFLLYRKYLQPGWQHMVPKLSQNGKNRRTGLLPTDDYQTRTVHYVRAMDEIARQKAAQIADVCAEILLPAPILDIGGGAGAIAKRLRGANCTSEVFIFELPEVIRAAQQLYPEPEDWIGIHMMEGNFLTHEFSEQQRFGTIVVSNFLHVYDPATARQLLRKSLGLLRQDGFLLIHDYFPDRNARYPHKGRLYDLNMMLNTYNGVCHAAECITSWLDEAGVGQTQIIDLPSDTSIILSTPHRA